MWIFVTWLSILISVSVSLSCKAFTRDCMPAPVMKLDSRLRLCSVLLARSMSLNACEDGGRSERGGGNAAATCAGMEQAAAQPWSLTTATGSLLRVAAMLNFFTCVFFSMALAMSFRVGIGMFCKINGSKGFGGAARGHATRCFSHSVGLRFQWTCGAARRTLMLLRLTSVKEASLLFILCSVSSTLVGFGGSSNTGNICSPLMTSRRHRQEDEQTVTLGGNTTRNTHTPSFKSLIQLTVVTFFTSSSRVRLATGDQCVNTQDGCGQKQWLISHMDSLSTLGEQFKTKLTRVAVKCLCHCGLPFVHWPIRKKISSLFCCRLTCQITQLCVRGAGQGLLQLWVEGGDFLLARFYRLLLRNKYFTCGKERGNGVWDKSKSTGGGTRYVQASWRFNEKLRILWALWKCPNMATFTTVTTVSLALWCNSAWLHRARRVCLQATGNICRMSNIVTGVRPQAQNCCQCLTGRTSASGNLLCTFWVQVEKLGALKCSSHFYCCSTWGPTVWMLLYIPLEDKRNALFILVV